MQDSVLKSIVQMYSYDSISRSYSIKRTVPKNFKKYLFNIQYDLKISFLLHEKLNGLNFFKKSLLNVQYDLKNQGLNILTILSYNRVMRVLSEAKTLLCSNGFVVNTL